MGQHAGQPGRRRRRLIGTLIFIVSVVGRSTLHAQVPTQALAVTRSVDAAPAIDPDTDSVRLLVGRSTIVDVGKPIARVSLTSADVADAMVTSPNELLINGKMAGTISMFVWDRAGAVRRYEVVVQRDLARLSAQLKELFPKESIDVRANGKTAVLSGTVSSKDVADKMASLAGSFVESKEELVSLLQVGPAGRSNQVLLQVRFAEVSRSAMTELGLGFFTSPTGIKNTIGRVTTQQFPAPGFDALETVKSGPDAFDFGGDVTKSSGKFTFSDFLNLFLFNSKYDLGMTLKALQNKGLFQSLAEPNLVAESGKEASFLAGGEFPIPVAQASGGGTSISIVFKEFGIRLNFTPVVNGDRVHLKVRPEVSALDFSNAITLGGFRIPALSTRRTETEIELNDGQTFAIAGLLNNTMNSTMQKIPGIGDIPILGLLFKSKAAQKNQTELVVMITPHILRNDSPGVTPALPRIDEPFMPPLTPSEVVPGPPPAYPVGSIGASQPTTAAAAQTPAPAVSEAPSAAAAAAAMTAMSPATRSFVRAPDPEPAKPAAAPAAASQTTAADGTNLPISAEDRQAAERASKEERRRSEAELKAKTEESKRLTKQAEQDRRTQKLEAERQATIAREQAVREGEAAKLAEEQARRQAEIDKKRGKAIAEAELKLKAAQGAYQAELAKQQ